MKRFLGIDYGTIRIGLAISDPLGMIASGFKLLNHKGKDMTEIAQEIKQIVEEKDVSDIVLGLPKRTDGRLGEKEKEVREFANILEEITGLMPIFHDERYTTVIAHQYMNKVGVKANKKRQIVDQLAAEILLQSYLEKIRL